MRYFVAWIAVMAGLVLGRVALAQQEPLMGSEAVPLPAISAAGSSVLPAGFGGEDGVYRILVVGDSLAGGLGAGMARMAETETGFEILSRFNESSGLARPEVYDWAAAIPKIVENTPVDAIVVLMGVNDRQGIRDGNTRYVFKAPGWEKAYTASVDQLLAVAKQAKAKLFWISLPPMANAVFDADMRYLSDIHRSRVAAAGAQFIDVRPFFLDSAGGFVDRGPDDTGVERKLRARDGITFFRQGNNRFGQLVLGAVKALEAGAATTTAAPAVAASLPVAASVAPVEPNSITVVAVPPSFGQAGLDGEDLTFRADVVQPIAKPAVSVAVRTAADAQGTANPVALLHALVGSNAQALFEQGVSANAPAGRFDDFSMPDVK